MIKRSILGLGFALLTCGAFGAPQAQGQVVVLGGPVFPIAPVVSYRPVVVPPLPAPVAVTSYRYSVSTPVVAPVTTYTRYTVTRPAYYAPPIAAVPIRPIAPVVVRPKYYVPGQPVRNTVRAITP